MSWDHQAAVEQLTRSRHVLTEDHAATLSMLQDALAEIDRLRKRVLPRTSVYMPLHEIRIVDGLDEDGTEVMATSFIKLGDESDIIPLGVALQMLELGKLELLERFGYFEK